MSSCGENIRPGVCVAYYGRKILVVRESARDGYWVLCYASQPETEFEFPADSVSKWQTWERYRAQRDRERVHEAKRRVAVAETRSQAKMVRALLAEHGIEVSSKVVARAKQPELHLVARGPQATRLTELLFESLGQQADGLSPLDVLEGQV